MKFYFEKILQEENYFENSYFRNLEKKTFDQNEFIGTQIQFYFAIENFSLAIANLCSKIPNTHERLEIVRNLWEEHGNGNLNNMHIHTFETLLSRLLNDQNFDITNYKPGPEVLEFNFVLRGVCAQADSYLMGVALLGMIEYMFSDISGFIGESIVNNGWLAKEQLIHYNLHRELDIKHSQDFFDLLEEPWKESEEKRKEIKQGLALGAFTFNSLYKNLFNGKHKFDR